MKMLRMVDERVRLPPELLLMIAKHLTDTDCLAISLSGLFDGFTSLYNRKRKPNNITIDYKYFFLSDPKCWNTFFNQHALSPSSITSFNANNCYWIPAERLCYAVVKMENLEELSIKGTKVSLPHLARIFELCSKITQLDFTCYEIKWEEIQKEVVEQNHSIDFITQGFKKLTSLQVSTRIHDARDYLNDPWVIITRMLSWCRADCKELTVEIIYTGDPFDRNKEGGSKYSWQDIPLTSSEEEIKRKVQEDFFPHLDWILSLKKLVLIKLGDFNNHRHDFRIVRSLLLENLFDWLVEKEKPFDLLRCLWIQDFDSPNICDSTLFPDSSAGVIQSYYVKDEDIDFSKERYSKFHSIQHIGGVDVTSSEIINLPKLKYVRGHPTLCIDDDKEPAQEDEYQQNLRNFILNHQEIEYLNVEFMESDYVPSLDLKLPKLQELVFQQDLISKEVVDAFVVLYPNLELLQLNNNDCKNDILNERACLSAIRFRNLTSLHLYGNFELHDGAFLTPLIKQCPKLGSLHMTGSLEPTAFLWNLGLFLPLAINLRDFRLEWKHHGNGFTFLMILKSLLGCALHLERLALINQFPGSGPVWDHPPESADFLVNFALKMKRMVCCCLVFNRIDWNLIKDVYERIENEVVPKRPSLWFHLGRGELCASDPDVPSIHFHEMVDPEYYTPPPTF